MESLDKPLQGLESRAIDAKQVLICCHPDGSEWVLGQGSFGTVSPACALEQLTAPCTSPTICMRRFPASCCGIPAV